jgi:hypothetical protein
VTVGEERQNEKKRVSSVCAIKENAKRKQTTVKKALSPIKNDFNTFIS